VSGYISFASHSSPDQHEARARPVARRFLPATVFALLALAGNGLAGCAKGEIVGAGGANGGATGGATRQGTSGAGGTIQVTIDTTPTGIPSSVDAEVTSQMVGCDGGDGCTCPPLNVAVLGKPGKWGANPNGDPDTALQDWLNSSSAGTARVDNFTSRVTLTPDFLATYNVIILASLSDDSNVGPWWTYSADEIAAFQAWIENGGGVISLTGYSSGDEMAPSNQLIGFSGITYNSDGVWGSCIDWTICNCTHSNTLSDWVRTDPVIVNLSTGVTLVGYENGHSINAPADGHVAATMTGMNALVGKLVGNGRVLAYGDEWITYTSQWTGAGDPSATDPSCQGELPQDKYQIAQFWYNMIHWSQPAANCFTIVDTTTPIMIW
jgi:hypothetical protein